MAKMTLDELTSQLRAAYGAELRSIVLYGSAAAGEHIPRHSDQNVLVIVNALPPTVLQAASAASRAWSDAGNPAPLTLTMTEWRGSSDIFPMEYADILERHRVLHGEDPTQGMTVEARDLRLQLEQEAMGKLLRLRQGVLASGGDASRQIDLLDASLTAIMIIFRAFLRLHGTSPSTDNAAVTEAVARRAGFDAAPFIRVVQHVRGAEKLTSDDIAPVIAGYLLGMERLVGYLDGYQLTA
jgi:hypothetical protein